jgi:DNA adenine methylase
MEITIPKPILKWVGGKTQIRNKLVSKFPKEINNYREIFLGGGSVLFAFLACIKNGSIKINGSVYAYDINEPLIYLYKNIQSNPDEFYNEMQTFIQTYHSCGNGDINRNPKNMNEAIKNKENYYYWMRNKYNTLHKEDKKSIMGSAMFLFLNKTCFRGLFRVGPNGFNVPYGNYKNPEIINKEHLFQIHDFIQDVHFECCDFTVSLKNIQSNDYVYLDPPYHKEETNSFVNYTENGFHIETQQMLFDICKEINNNKEKNIKFMMSNSNTLFVIQNFPEEELYHLEIIDAKRSINSKTPNSKTTELIITNYLW